MAVPWCQGPRLFVPCSSAILNTQFPTYDHYDDFSSSCHYVWSPGSKVGRERGNESILPFLTVYPLRAWFQSCTHLFSSHGLILLQWRYENEVFHYMDMSPTETLLPNEQGRIDTRECLVISSTISSSLFWINQNSFFERPLCFVWKLFNSFYDLMLILDQNFKTDNIKDYEWIHHWIF